MNKLLIIFTIFYSSITFADNWIDRAKNITTNQELTKTPLACLEFEKSIKDNGKRILVSTFEHHSGACKGDPKTRPKLFYIEFNTKTKSIRSNAKSNIGQLELIGRLQ
jgi:hypothetical protein